MSLRILAEGVVVAGKFAEVVEAYNGEQQFSGLPATFIHGRYPTDDNSLREYGEFPVVAFGLLMSGAEDQTFEQQRLKYPDGGRIVGTNLRDMRKENIYFKPTLIQSEGRALWHRNESDF